MKIGDSLEVLELNSAGPNGMQMLMNLTFVWDNDNAILFDTGDPFKLEAIRDLIGKTGVPFKKLNKIIITHHDMDHIGSLESLVKKSGTKIEVMAHKLEEPYITGEKLSIKMTPESLKQMKEDMENMPPEGRKAMEQLTAKRDVKIGTYLNDSDELPYCGGIKIIHTPGHTPGHICAYLKKYKALVAGDAMNVMDGKLDGPSPEYSYRIEKARESLKKIAQYDIETIICYHGGIYKNPNERIQELSTTIATGAD